MCLADGESKDASQEANVHSIPLQHSTINLPCMLLTNTTHTGTSHSHVCVVQVKQAWNYDISGTTALIRLKSVRVDFAYGVTATHKVSAFKVEGCRRYWVVCVLSYTGRLSYASYAGCIIICWARGGVQFLCLT